MSAKADEKIKAYLDVYRRVHEGKIPEPKLEYKSGWVTMYHYNTTRRVRLAELDELTKLGESFLK